VRSAMSPFQDARRNLALEETLYRSVEEGDPGWLLFWRDAPSVVLGRFQNPEAEVDPEALRARGAVLARRITGGGAVYHDLGVLNFSLLAPAGRSPGLLEETAQAMAGVLRGLGLPAEHTGRNDVTVEGRKVCGMAGTTGGPRQLCHGSVLVDCDLDALGRVLRPDPEKYALKGLASVRSRVANLMEFLPGDATPGEASRSLLALWRERAEAVEERLSEDVLGRALTLAREKYETRTWTFGETARAGQTLRGRFPWGRVEVRCQVRDGYVEEYRIFGDFFGHENISRVENALLGLRPGASEFRDALRGLPLRSHFLGCDPEELVHFLGGSDSGASAHGLTQTTALPAANTGGS